MCTKIRHDPHNYTLKRAFNWGICSSHFSLKKERNCFGRVFHFGIGLLEILPIVAFLELIAIKLLSRPISKEPKNLLDESLKNFKVSKTRLPKPSSVRPVLDLVRRRNAKCELVRFWPKNLKILGLTPKEALEVDNCLKEAFTTPVAFHYKKRDITFDRDKIKRELPISLKVQKIENKKGYTVWLFPNVNKTSFMKGGERKIGWAYKLSTGELFLKKRIVGRHEQRIIETLSQPQSIVLRVVEDKAGNKKRQVLEKICDGTPPILFGTEALADISTKHNLLKDFLNELLTLNQMQFELKVKIPEKKYGLMINKEHIFKHQGFHNDIKVDNLLVFKDENGFWHGKLCDFGVAAANPDAWCISLGYTPPEYIRYYHLMCPDGLEIKKKFPDRKGLIEFNIEHAQKKDIWDMGLVSLSILAEETKEALWKQDGKYFKVKIAPLECLKSCMSPGPMDKYEEIGILKLTQKVLDAEIDRLQKRVEAEHSENREAVAKLFKLIKSMLRIDHKQRPTVQDLLATMD